MTDLELRELQHDKEVNEAKEGKRKYYEKKDEIYRQKGSDKLVLEPEVDMVNRKVEELADYIERFKTKTTKTNPTTYQLRKILTDVDSYELAHITMQFCMNRSGMRTFDERGRSTNTLTNQAVKLGRRVKEQINFVRFKKAMPGYSHVVLNKLKASAQRHKHKVLSYLINTKKKDVVKPIDWTTELYFTVGYRLMSIVVGKIGLFEIVDGRVQTMKGQFKRGAKVLVMKPTLLTWLEKYHKKCTQWKPYKQPMVCPPVDWSKSDNGGYLHNKAKEATSLLMTQMDGKRLEINERLDRDQPKEFYKAINMIQSTPWKINEPIRKVMEQFKNGGQAGIPSMDIKLELPKKTTSKDPDEILKYKREATECYDKFHLETSKRSAFLAKLAISESHTKFDKIYFPLQCDWRTRNYPEPFFLHPQGDDLARGLLLFAEGKEIGMHDAGHSWLAIHAANCYGEDKCSFNDRVKWVQDNHKKILDAVNDPYKNLWWTEADKPFQFLAVCMELVELWVKGSVISHIPVQMDGTCNGLQNFSMLMRDEIGGEAVNLIDLPKPSDIYTVVLNKAKELVEYDGKNLELDLDTQKLANEWRKAGLNRKLAKRNTMTLPYGATSFGFADQLVSEMKQLIAKKKIKFPNDLLFDACRYLAKVNYEAMGKVVVKAVECMSWMQTITKVLAKEDITANWRTPLGVRIEQKNFRIKSKQIKTYWGGTKIRLRMNKETSTLYGLKMANGIAPNFIHSLDASHLLKTVLCLAEHGITDVSMIHDSYGVHATEVDQLHKCIRSAFVDMYSGNVLKEFYESITADLDEETKRELPPMPELGNLDPEAVLKSTYFFA